MDKSLQRASGRPERITMKIKYRWIIVFLVLIICAFAGCQKQQETLLLYEETDAATQVAVAEDDDGQNGTAGQSAGNAVTVQTGGAEQTGVTEQTAGGDVQNDAAQSAGEPVKSGGAAQTTGNVGTQQPGEAAVCVVHVCGAVQNPGVYSLAEGSRIYEAVAAAGGLLPEADEAYLNQAACVTDGEQIYVPTQQEVLEQSVTLVRNGQQTESGIVSQDTKVNLNTATKEQLCTLPGIGESKAESIISYRNEHGAYGQIEDIMKVEGIKDGLFQKIKDRITV